MNQCPANSPSTEPGWRSTLKAPSLPEVYRSVPIPKTGTGWLATLKRLLAFSGPGYLVAVGYMDPGNWATDLAGGSQFNYALLSAVVLSSLMAIFLQHLALKLGIATGRDLAQACRDHFSKPVAIILWVLCEIAIAACDLAEVIGSAIALNLLFHIPLLWGVCLTALDVFVILFLQNKGFRFIEALVITLIGIITISFGIQIALSRPDIGPMLASCIPSPEIVKNPQMLYLAIGILGATVMPHNLYLHSSVVQTRNYENSSKGKREAILFGTIDSTVALSFALLINASILIVSAATFFRSGQHDVDGIEKAYHLLPILGPMAPIIFAIALLASGQNSTLTGTLAGQVVMEGFLHLRLPPIWRRMMTRALAIIPAIIVTAYMGAKGTDQLLILSQVVLSLQLSFAVVPLIWFTSDRKKMGEFANPPWMIWLGGTMAVVIAALNILIVWGVFAGKS
jgi:manganese transport protein